MLSPFICGSFQNQELEEEDQASPCTTPTRKSRKSSKDNKNPYSTRGLDKFSALLAELEEKRQKIYSQVGSDDISFVRFVYSSSNDCVPVIVKVKDHSKSPLRDHQHVTKEKTLCQVVKEKTSCQSPEKPKSPKQETRLMELDDKKILKEKKKVYFKLNKWRRPSFYMPIFMILILIFLAFFGRSVAILCTSIGWYLVPTLNSKTPEKLASLKKKKTLVRRVSEVGPRSKNNFNGDLGKDMKSPHGRQCSF
ncbi:ZCF37 [Euphorbia peplus]|nr:ZCF37 [Euphorbia peplus]